MKRPTGPLNRPGALDDVLGAPVEQLPILTLIGGAAATGAAVGAVEGGILGGALGSVLPGPGTTAGIVTGAGTGAVVGSRSAAAIAVFKLEASLAFAEFQSLTDEEGKPLSEEEIASLPSAPVVGALAPDFTILDVKANSFTLSESLGNPTALMFFHSW